MNDNYKGILSYLHENLPFVQSQEDRYNRFKMHFDYIVQPHERSPHIPPGQVLMVAFTADHISPFVNIEALVENVEDIAYREPQATHALRDLDSLCEGNPNNVMYVIDAIPFAAVRIDMLLRELFLKTDAELNP